MTHSSKPSIVRVVIVEDDDHTRANLCTAVAAMPGFALIASFDRMQPAIAWLETTEADVLLTDLGLPDGSGIELIRICSARWPHCDIMVITMFGDEKNVLSSIEAGATGYILKDGDQLDMSQAIQDLRAGGSPMSPLIARKVLERALQRTAPAVAPTVSRPPASPMAPPRDPDQARNRNTRSDCTRLHL